MSRKKSLNYLVGLLAFVVQRQWRATAANGLQISIPYSREKRDRELGAAEKGKFLAPNSSFPLALTLGATVAARSLSVLYFGNTAIT